MSLRVVAAVGDLAIFPVRDRIVVGYVLIADNANRRIVVAWGDFQCEVSDEIGKVFVCPRGRLLKSAGATIGTSWPNIRDAAMAVKAHYAA